MQTKVGIRLRRSGHGSLSSQIFEGIRASIVEGRLPPGTRLPSWNDLAAQLGVARGTVHAAYERLTDENLITAAGAAGTHVKGGLPIRSAHEPVVQREFEGLFHRGQTPPLPFQMGVPAADLFPLALWTRLHAAACRQYLQRPATYADPRGEASFRSEIAGYLAVARGLSCQPSQVFITNGYAGAMGIVAKALRLHGAQVWVEQPGYPFARSALHWAGASPMPVPVDEFGIQVEIGIETHPAAGFALVTPGQQSPLGFTMSLERRQTLLDWALSGDRWIIEDDYLGELQLERHAAPALASIDDRRVMHIGSFSKTISPSLRLGYLVVPQSMVSAVTQVVGTLDPAPTPLTQIAVGNFMGQGHFLRHLRRMKRAYAERMKLLIKAIEPLGVEFESGGLSVLLHLPQSVSDTLIASEAQTLNLAPAPLSPWYPNGTAARNGLLLGVTNLDPQRIDSQIEQLMKLIAHRTQ